MKNKATPPSRKTHGMCGTPTYAAWCRMKSRCYNKNSSSFDRYGGKGIAVCDRWRNSFENFLEDMGIRPDGMTLDRLDPTNGYSPENCRWATKFQQNSENKSNLVVATLFGETHNLSEWARRLGVKSHTLRMRVERGLSPEDAIRLGKPRKNKYAGIRNKGENRKKPWQAYVKRDGKQIIIGYFETKGDALVARNNFLSQHCASKFNS